MDVSQFIRANFPLSPAPSVPEIVVHKAGPKSGLWRLAEADAAFGNPYWAYHWGGGLALARYVLDQPEAVAGKRILDMGAGSGIVGIAAMKAGAASVVAADVDPYAVAAIKLNAEANGVAVEAALGDLTHTEPPEVDVILVGDLFYNEELAASVARFLDRCLAKGIEVRVGDPWRAFLPRTRLRLLKEYPGVDFGSSPDGELHSNAVFAFG
ncbi:MAG: methyltransferase [Alphaproteobacteria bacterium]|nr:MAG: methyltransferase [Alphaproteobacteria bacterium]